MQPRMQRDAAGDVATTSFVSVNLAVVGPLKPLRNGECNLNAYKASYYVVHVRVNRIDF